MINPVSSNGRITQINARTLDVNAYIIEQPKYLVVIDSLLLPQDSKELAALADSYHKPVRYLINTHFHSDHCLGNRHIKQPETIQINQRDYWQTIEREKAMINPRKYKPVDTQRLTKADVVFAREYKFDDLIIIHTPGHSPDSCCIYLAAEKALIAGDTILSNSGTAYSLPYFFWGCLFDLLNSLENISQMDIMTIYCGHGLPLEGKNKIISDMIYLKRLRSGVEKFCQHTENSHELAKLLPVSECLPVNKKPAVEKVHELNIRQLLAELQKKKLHF